MVSRGERTDQLVAGLVHVWRFDLEHEPSSPETGLLSQEEIERANRFHFARDRRRFVVARAATKTILAHYLGVTARDVVFTYGLKGKPELGSSLSHSGLTFNLSHARDQAILAVTREAAVGVDLEYIDQEFASEKIARSFFSPREIDTLRSLPAAQQAAAFFSCWTRKEAYIKAVGGGLSIPLDSFDVAFGPETAPALLRADGFPDSERLIWRMYNLLAPEGYAAALVVEGTDHRLEEHRWRDQFQR